MIPIPGEMKMYKIITIIIMMMMVITTILKPWLPKRRWVKTV